MSQISSYVAASDICQAMGWSRAALSPILNNLGWKFPIIKSRSQGVGRSRDFFEVCAVVEMLDRVLARGLDTETAQRLLKLARPETDLARRGDQQ